MDKLLRWIKDCCGLCEMAQRPVVFWKHVEFHERWHFARTYRVWHGFRYCASCWRRTMLCHPEGTRAWRIEHTGVTQ